MVQRQIPTYRIIPGRPVLGVWWQPHQGLSLSPAAEKASSAPCPNRKSPNGLGASQVCGEPGRAASPEPAEA